MSVSKRTRFEVLKRDNHTCRYCGGTAPDVVLVVDHVTPVALGGRDDPSNLVAACRDCNAGKSSTSPTDALVADVSADAMRWTAAMKQAREMFTDDLETKQIWVGEVHDAVVGNWPRYALDRYPTIEAIRTLTTFYERGVRDKRAIHRAVHIAWAAKRVPVSGKWTYACGVIWNEIRDVEERAKAIYMVDSEPI